MPRYNSYTLGERARIEKYAAQLRLPGTSLSFSRLCTIMVYGIRYAHMVSIVGSMETMFLNSHLSLAMGDIPYHMSISSSCAYEKIIVHIILCREAKFDHLKCLDQTETIYRSE